MILWDEGGGAGGNKADYVSPSNGGIDLPVTSQPVVPTEPQPSLPKTSLSYSDAAWLADKHGGKPSDYLHGILTPNGITIEQACTLADLFGGTPSTYMIVAESFGYIPSIFLVPERSHAFDWQRYTGYVEIIGGAVIVVVGAVTTLGSQGSLFYVGAAEIDIGLAMINEGINNVRKDQDVYIPSLFH